MRGTARLCPAFFELGGLRPPDPRPGIRFGRPTREPPDDPDTDARPALRQHHPRAGHRRRAEGQLRPPGPAAGRRAHGLLALRDAPEAQPREPGVARPRPLRALGRPRLDAALQPAAPHRLRPAARRAQAFRQWGSHTPGHPEHGDTPGRRDDDRPARPGLRERAWAWRWPSAISPRASTGPGTRSSTTTPTCSPATATSWRASRTRRRRSPGTSSSGKLVVLYDDNHISPGGLHRPRRSPRTSSRRFDGVRLARREGGRRERPRGHRARDRRREGGDGPALARDRADRDRLRQPEAGHVRRARLAARRRAGDRRRSASWATRPRSRSSFPRRPSRTCAARSSAGSRPRPSGAGASRPTARPTPTSRPSSSG